jgi:hypothetical protein
MIKVIAVAGVNNNGDCIIANTNKPKKGKSK